MMYARRISWVSLSGYPDRIFTNLAANHASRGNHARLAQSTNHAPPSVREADEAERCSVGGNTCTYLGNLGNDDMATWRHGDTVTRRLLSLRWSKIAVPYYRYVEILQYLVLLCFVHHEPKHTSVCQELFWAYLARTVRLIDTRSPSVSISFLR